MEGNYNQTAKFILTLAVHEKKNYREIIAQRKKSLDKV